MADRTQFQMRQQIRGQAQMMEQLRVQMTVGVAPRLVSKTVHVVLVPKNKSQTIVSWNGGISSKIKHSLSCQEEIPCIIHQSENQSVRAINILLHRPHSSLDWHWGWSSSDHHCHCCCHSGWDQVHEKASAEKNLFWLAWNQVNQVNQVNIQLGLAFFLCRRKLNKAGPKRRGVPAPNKPGNTGSQGTAVNISTMPEGQDARASDGYLVPTPQVFPNEAYSRGSADTGSIYAEPYQPVSFGQNDSVYEDIENWKGHLLW